MNEPIKMCRGKGCCPEAVFHDDGSITVQEHGEAVHFSKEALEVFMEEVAKRNPRVRG